MKTLITMSMLLGYLGALGQEKETALQIECDPAAFKQIISEGKLPDHFTTCHFTGLAHDVRWQQMMSWLSEQPAVKEIIFEENGLSQIPQELGLIQQISTITIVGNQDILHEEALEVLMQLPQLEQLRWELFSIDDLPYEVIDHPKLKDITIISDEFVDHHITPLGALYLADVEKSEITRMRDRTDPAAGSIRILYISPKEEKISSPALLGNVVANNTGQQSYKAAVRVDCPAKKFDRQYQSFSSPMPSLNVQKEYYAFNNSDATLITAEQSGTQVIIPSGSFIDANGQEVLGEVLIDYREFRDPADFILSGIPMSFPKNDTMIFFQSAGMFEINASQNGEEVFLKDNCLIKMNFASTDTTDSYNFYSFNDNTGEWEEKSKTRATTASDLVALSTLTPAINSYLWWQGSRENPSKADTTLFADRFESMRYGYQNLLPVESKKSKKNKYHILREKDRVRVGSVRKTRENQIVFDVMTTNGSHPEMSQIGIVTWMLNDDMELQAFKKKYSLRRSYMDVRLLETAAGYEIVLKGDSGFTKLPVLPVRKKIDDKGKIYYAQQPIRYVAYQKALLKRAAAFDKHIHKIRRDYARNFQKSDEQFWQKVRPIMSDEERAMTFDAWKLYCEARIQESRKINANTLADQNSLMLSFQLDGMGVFNCDQYERLEEPVIVLAHYKDDNKRNMSCDKVYLVDPKMNAVLIYDHFHALTPSKLAIDKRSDFRMVVQNARGEFGYIDPADINHNELLDGKNFTFEVEMTGELSVQEFRRHLGLAQE
jgi:hypothetical protein